MTNGPTISDFTSSFNHNMGYKVYSVRVNGSEFTFRDTPNSDLRHMAIGLGLFDTMFEVNNYDATDLGKWARCYVTLRFRRGAA